MEPSKSIITALEAVAGGDEADKHESQNFDLKQYSESPKATAATLSRAPTCFANAEGGTIIPGVRDKVQGPDTIVGTAYEADWCRQRIHELVTPSQLTEVTPFTFHDKQLLQIRVPPGINMHEFDGRFWHRAVSPASGLLPTRSRSSATRDDSRTGALTIQTCLSDRPNRRR